MKKRKLTKAGKVIFTSIVLIISVVVYHLMGVLGSLATEGIIYQLILIFGWGWLFIGQLAVISVIWE